MRHTKTFILRLYTDQNLREKTCGNLQALPGRKAHSFRNNTELLNLLKHLSKEEETDIPIKISFNNNETKSVNENQPTE